MNKPKICLVMIVKNEERVMARCLQALKPYVDYWVIVDTGSTDDTPAIITNTMESVPGEIYYREFQSFQHNRTEVMALARKDFPDADYLLMMDADDTFEADNNFQWPELSHGAYNITHIMSETSWLRPALTKASLPWRYEGAAHEVMVCKVPHTTGKINGVRVHCGNDGARRVTEGRAKYKRIAGILEEEIKKDPSNRRNVFYLAQSYRDAGELEKAIIYYRKRSGMGGWPEEIWNSLFEIGKISERLELPWTECRDAYLTAYKYRPSRAESLSALASLHRRNDEPEMAYVYASAAVTTPRPDDALFVSESIYTWRSLDELCIAANKIGMLDIARESALKLLAIPQIDGRDRLRIEENFTFSCKPITAKKVSNKEKIAIVLATYKPEPAALRAAVQSIVDQSHKQWELFIVSDGNKNMPWEALDGLEDPRIHRFDLPKNCGQFPIYDTILKKTDAELFAVQDDDDISKPHRLQTLLKNMIRTNADVVFSDIEIEREDGKVFYWPAHPEWLGQNPNQIVHAGSHVGLWKTQSLRAIGGYYGGFDLGADTVIVGIMSRLGRPAFVRQGLYRAKRSKESMTTKADTGVESPARKKAWSDIYSAWAQINSTSDKLKKSQELLSQGAQKANLETLSILLK